ncbi:glycosyltransferase family 2 protein [Flavobacterium hibernum]|uniref:Glycosyltransferase 2-like domain-containing protein n=1 Tax=Flavobacterium hibernum TaxID=37752 RepID=A0ABX4CA15_9FLAO|nr:glycosyltransferase family 2 protein [Flavobacterium hibernum]OXA89694.1 hypothetical protein B0A73_04750 [Flavobacterium hibernum]
MKNPLISIIIPTYNRAHLISETLDSVLAQTYTNWECIIVDDGSTDNAFEVLNRYVMLDNRFKYFDRPTEKLKGPSSCRNFGIEKAAGEYIVFLDSDDLLSEKCLEDRIDFVQLNLDFDLWIFRTKTFQKEINDGGRVFNKTMKTYSDTSYLKMFLSGLNPFCVTSPLWKCDFLKSIDGFDERLSVFEDPELHIRAFLNEGRSITSRSDSCDSFYRVSHPDFNFPRNREKMIKTHESAFLLFKTYLEKHNKIMRSNCIDFFKNYVFYDGTFYDSVRFYFLYLRFNIFNFKQIILVPVIILYKLMKIENFKGLGVYKLRNLIFSK